MFKKKKQSEAQPAEETPEVELGAEEKKPVKKTKKKRKKKKGSWTTWLLIFIFLVGMCIMLYPTFSDWWNSRVQSRAINNYSAALDNLTEEEHQRILQEAKDYNERLWNTPGSFYEPSIVEGYNEALNVDGTGVMGYIDIEKINVHLPIYHSTTESVLQIAVGHLEGSSLPVGGATTHAVLSAHRGLPSAKLFSDLDQMEIGDTFTITVLDQVLTYQVDQIRIVLPYELDDLQIENGKDYCTLQTCTPYGINTHRMLVRGVRIETIQKSEQVVVKSEAKAIDPAVVIPLAAMPILLVLLIALLVKYRKKK